MRGHRAGGGARRGASSPDCVFWAPMDKKDGGKRPGKADTEEWARLFGVDLDAPKDDGGDLFRRAMSGVKPIAREGLVAPRRRAAAPAPPSPDEAPLPPPPPPAAAGPANGAPPAPAPKHVEVSPLFQRIECRGRDCTKAQFADLLSGASKVEARIDLHGLDREQAEAATDSFVGGALHAGRRVVLVICGKGHGSPGGEAVLKRWLADWLARGPRAASVLAFCSAQPKDGGTGAVYVLLRRRKPAGGR
mgnify:FL=1